MKILIIQQKMIGDVLTSTILFEALKEKYPKAELHYLINSHTHPVIENHPFVNKCLLFTPSIEKNNLKLFPFIASIRKEKYDIVIDIYSKLSSNLISLFSKSKIKISYYKKHTSSIYTHTIKRSKHTETATGLEISNRLQLLTPLGINKKSIKPKIYLTSKEITNAKTHLTNNGVNTKTPLFMISVLGSAKNKTYPLPYMAKIIDAIVANTNAEILFNYIPNQVTDAKTIFDFCKKETQKYIHFNIFGKNLREFLAITKHCNALIGNEGGAVNMAKALDISTFSIFSPWIDKEGWNMFEDGKTNTSVHLKDYKPELFNAETLKVFKNESELLYKKFLPELIIPALNTYLQQFKTKV